MNDHLEDMLPCIACLQGCVANMYKGEPICCLVNPFLGHEAEGLKKAETSQKSYGHRRRRGRHVRGIHRGGERP